MVWGEVLLATATLLRINMWLDEKILQKQMNAKRIREQTGQNPSGKTLLYQFYSELDTTLANADKRLGSEISSSMRTIIKFLEDGCTEEGSQTVQDILTMIMAAHNTRTLKDLPQEIIEENLLEEIRRVSLSRLDYESAGRASGSMLRALYESEFMKHHERSQYGNTGSSSRH